MNERHAIRKIEDGLRTIGLSARFYFRPADDLIPRDTFAVAIECEGQPFGEVRDSGATLYAAYAKAVARYEDATGRRHAA